MPVTGLTSHNSYSVWRYLKLFISSKVIMLHLKLYMCTHKRIQHTCNAYPNSGSVLSVSIFCVRFILERVCLHIYGVLNLESDNLHEDVRQGRIPDERKEIDRDEKNPPSNGEAIV